MEFYIKNFFSKCDQIRSFLRIWSHLLKKFLMENFIFCVVLNVNRKLSLNFMYCFNVNIGLTLSKLRPAYEIFSSLYR